MFDEINKVKNLYRIPVQVVTFDPSLKKMITLDYDIEADLVKGQNFGVLIASAQSQAEKKFYKKYPAHKIDTINVDIEKKEFICKLKIKDRHKKPRTRKLPFPKEPREKVIEYLGKDTLNRRIIEVSGIIVYLYPRERAIFNHTEDKLIITYYQDRKLEYVKILSENVNGMPVLVKWKLESIFKRHPEYVEKLNGEDRYSTDSLLPKNEFKICIRIAKKKFKKYLQEVEKDG